MDTGQIAAVDDKSAELYALSGRIWSNCWIPGRLPLSGAGHKLNPSMTIVSTDVDLAEMERGENQWLTDIRRQSE